MIYLIEICKYIYFIFIKKEFYHLKLQYITTCNLQGCVCVFLVFFKFYYCISDIVIYLVYIDLMQKHCQLINVDVDVDSPLCFSYSNACHTVQ